MIKVVSALVLAAAMSSSATLSNSNTSFREALHACSGALGSVSFASNHARIASAEGVDTFEGDFNENGTMRATLESSDGKKYARVTVNQRHRSVFAGHLRTTMGGRVACIYPD